MNQKNKKWIPLPNLSPRLSTSRLVSRIALAVTCLIALQATPTLLAADVTWSSTGTSTPGGDGDWTGGATWWNGSSAISWTDGDNAIFTALGNTTVNSSVTVNSIAFTNSTNNISILNGTGDITLNSGITARNSANTAARTFTISESIALGASQTWGVTNGGATGTANLLVSGSISGSGYGITKTGNGTLTLSGTNNTYTGTTTISAGTVIVGSALQNNKNITGNILINGGTLQFTNANQIADTASVTMSSGNVVFNQTETINSYSQSGGSNNLTGNLTVNSSSAFTGGSLGVGARAAVLTLNGPITLGNYTFTWGAGSPLANGIVFGGDVSVDAGTTTTFSSPTGRITLTNNRVIDVGAGANMNVQWTVVGAGSFEKSGTGTLTLTGANTYSNGTLVSAGTLVGNSTSLQRAITNNSAVIFNNTADGTYSGVMSGTGTLTKTGAGALTLSGANTYTGATLVSAGSMIVNGSTAAGSTLTVDSGATLGGSGTINGAANVNGNLQPGNSPGLLTFGDNLTLGATANTTFEINGDTLRGTDYDGINVTSALTYNGTMTLAVGTTFGVGSYTFNLFDFGSQSGSFTTIALSGNYSGNLTGPGNIWSLTSGNETWTYTHSTGDLGLEVVPEPSTYALLMVAAAGLGAHVVRRRRKR